MPVLYVTLRRASDLPASDFSFTGAKSDPYVTIEVERQVRKSACIKNELNPVWRPPERFHFDVDDVSAAILQLRVFDYDTLNQDDLLGSLVVPLAKFANMLGQSFVEVFALDVPAAFSKQKRRSTIELELCLTALDDGAQTLTMWENETWSVGSSWTPCNTSDRQQWSSDDGSATSATFSDIAPPVPPLLEGSGWEYCAKRGDNQGWVYAPSWAGPWATTKGRLSFVRRRQWENHCTPLATTAIDKQGSVMF